MTSFEKTLLTTLAALLLGALVAFGGAPKAFADDAAVEDVFELAQGYDTRRNMELTQERVPLETVIAQIGRSCPGQLINARHDAPSNRYIVRWETNDHRIVSIQADAATGRILSGGC